MAILGKRKRRASLDANDATKQTEASSSNHLQKLLQKHFEATYEPLSTPAQPEYPSDDDDASNSVSSSAASDWDGLSDTSSPPVEVISHTSIPTLEDASETASSDRKTFMSSKPPTSTTLARPATNPSSTDPDNTLPSASSLSANDLALHRLLTESHLLSTPQNPTTSTTTAAAPNFTLPASLLPTLQARHKATDLRMLSLGAKTTLTAELNKTMPMSHRVGIEKKRVEKERERRESARREGVVLERPAAAGGKKDRDRDRGKGGVMRRGGGGDVGGPSVGRMKGATLVLGRGDLREINGPRGGGGGRGGRGGRGKRGGGRGRG